MRAAWWLTAGTGIALATIHAVVLGPGDGAVVEIGVALGGLLALGGGLLVWQRRPESLLGPLMILWSASGFLLDAGAAFPHSAAAVTLGWLFAAANPVLYAQLVLSFPTGRVPDRLDRRFVLAAYALRIAWVVPPLLFGDPRGCADCAIRSPSLLFTGHAPDLTVLGQSFDIAFAAFGVGFIALVVRRFLRSNPGSRRTFGPVGLVASLATLSFAGRGLLDAAGSSAVTGALDWADRISTALVPVALVAGVLATRRARGSVADLVLELDRAGPGHVRDALAASVGDPTLELALWLPERSAWVDESGRAVVLPDAGNGRAVTLIGRGDERLAALVHDPDIVDQRSLLEAAGTAARLALENERLHAELRRQLAELRASRVRIVKAGDAERRRLERDLHDGAQQRLLGVGLALQLLRSRVDGTRDGAALLDEAELELQSALRELRELARGIHPAILVEHGLEAAVRTVAERSPVPVSVSAHGARLPAHVETAAYFVIAESLANVAKHARATHATVEVMRANGSAVVEISDDGVGGADPDAGSGLRGLADRIGALDGELTVESPAGAGTRVRVEIPCA